jgi:aspartyl-tRNA(Asn)/glutamyl-tRNA(Gln) amidotransferase subunit A
MISAAAHALDRPILEVARALRTRALSPVALTEAALDRIQRLGPSLNCFITVTPEVALSEARAAEGEIRQGHYRSVIHGIPYGLKDNIDTKGIRTTWGARPYADRVPDRDATVVKRLRDAGAVLLGKLSMLELAGGLGVTWAQSSLNGACRNPWDLTRSAGSSSSGSAAAVAAGLVGFALGTETLGSLMNPAAFCGVTAFRPTFGVIPRDGVLPFAFTLDKVGPVCRTAADCAAVAAILGDVDSLDPASVPAPRALAHLNHRLPPGVRAAVLPIPPSPKVPDGIRACYANALDTFRAAGVALEEATLPALPWQAVTNVILTAESEVAFEELLRSGRWRELSDPAHQHRARWRGLEGRPSDYVKAMAIRAELQRQMAEFFKRYDFILNANSPWLPPRIEEPFTDAYDEDPMSFIGNLLGLPAVSVPMGFVGPGKLPVALEIAGRPMADATVATAAAVFQSKTTWHEERPPV